MHNSTKPSLQNSIMSFKPIVVLVCLLALHACDANKFLPRGSGHYGGLSKRQDLTCIICMLPDASELQDVLSVLPELGESFRTIKTHFQKIFTTDINSTVDLQLVMYNSIDYIITETEDKAEQLYKALAKIDTCPPVETLFHGFETHFSQFLASFGNNWIELVNDVDVESRFAALAQAMVQNVPPMFLLIRDLVFYSMNILSHNECKKFGNVIIEFLNPEGEIAYTLSMALSSTGSAANDLVKSMFYSLLSEENGGGLDIWHMFERLLCGALGGLKTGISNSDLTGGYCPTQPEDKSFKLAVQNIVCGPVMVFGREILPKQYDVCFS